MSRLDELRQELTWRRWAKDPEAFFTEAWHIKHPERGRILFELRPAQRDGLAHWREHRYSLTLKARQLGWSTLVAAYAFWLVFFHPDREVIMISRTEREAVDLLRKSRYGFDQLPEWVRARGPRYAGPHQQRMAFANSSSIVSMPSANDPARGSTAALVVVDEWAFLPDAEAAWASIEPVADVGGRVVGLSTANGSGNFFHQLWVGAETHDNRFRSFFAPWSANTERDANWYEAKKASMLPWQLAQEYPTTPEEAFIRSGNPVFDLDDLAKYTTIEPRCGHLERRYSGDWIFHDAPDADDGPYRIFEIPNPEDRYVLGADVAEGLDHGDYSDASVISVSTGRLVAKWHGRIAPDLFARELELLGNWYSTALVAVEVNNHGLTTMTALRNARYPNLYRRRTVNQVFDQQTVQWGWQTSRTTKPLMVDELAAAIRVGELIIEDKPTLAELRTFVRDEKGHMHGSPHDDRVISLAIANQMRKWAHSPEYALRPQDQGTLGWWLRQGGGAQRGQPIGRNSMRGGRFSP